METRAPRPRLSSAGWGASTVIVVQEVSNAEIAEQNNKRRAFFMSKGCLTSVRLP